MGAIVGILGGVASNLLSDKIGDMLRPKQPTPFDIFFDLLPQIIGLIIISCMILSYMGIVKKYKIKIGLLLYPIGVAVLYCISLNISTLFSFLVVIAWAIAIFFTVVYIRDAYSIYKGTKKFKSATAVLHKTASILENDVKVKKDNTDSTRKEE